MYSGSELSSSAVLADSSRGDVAMEILTSLISQWVKFRGGVNISRLLLADRGTLSFFRVELGRIDGGSRGESISISA